ncbi:helix-turn-helix transcriptional regulator [Pseudonocardia acaciae]|uniref:helix-turn-helix transcriptional regulator n=1 Tax=Pseudonocardia acaciae TaxID=551276 RepID=UPI00048BCF0D|nr:helix-turn-helix transcriptional regulator [Pseudonocardia acaciae]
MDGVARRRELATFLRSRRERLTPPDVGLPEFGRRRTPGLRREEVAGLASMSVTYYTWLEQARDVSPSRAVVESLAGALRLDRTERAHLFALANHAVPAPTVGADPVHPTLDDMVAALDPNPAYVINQCWDVLAYNRAQAALVREYDELPRAERNNIWLLFADPALRSLLVNWSDEARSLLAKYRAAAAEHAGDARFGALTEALLRASREFREWWPRHDIGGFEPARKQFRHPAAGLLTVNFLKLAPVNHPEHQLLVYLPADASTADALARLTAG